jgi:hypothetical protein
VAWETRGGRRFFYTAVKRDGRTIKTFVGGGAVGEVAAGLVAESRRVRADQAAALEAERARLSAPDRAVAALDRACALAVEAALTAAGYHRCSYKWRRRHVRGTGPPDDRHARRG